MAAKADYLAQVNWLLIFFVAVFIVGDNKKRLISFITGVATIFGYFGYKIIRRAAYFGFETTHTVASGMGGQLADNNELAVCLNMALPILYALFLYQKSKPKKAFFMILFLMSMFAVIYTRSRGGLVGLAVLSIPMIYRLLFSTAKNKIVPVIMLSCILAFGYTYFYERVSKRVEDIEHWQTDQSATNRIISVISGYYMMADSPLFGQGSFSNIDIREFCPPVSRLRIGLDEDDVLIIRKPGHKYVIHNAYAALGGQYGVPSLILFVTLIIYNMFKCRSFRKEYPLIPENAWAHYFSNAFELSILVYAATAMFLNIPISRLFIWCTP